MDDAVDLVMNARGNRLADIRDVIMGFKSTTESNAVIDLSSYSLNKDQEDCAKAALIANECAVIQGPPGTGKTTTIVAMSQYLVSQKQQVLVVAPSNQAVDHLAIKLSEKGLNVIRLGQPYRLSEDVKRLSL